MFRETVWSNDTDRNWTVIWTRGDPLNANSYGFFIGGVLNDQGKDPVHDPVYLVDGAGKRWEVSNLCLRQQDWLECCYFRSFAVSPTTPNGQYQIVLNGQNQGTLTVATRTKPYTTLQPGRMLKLTTEPNRAYLGYQTTITGGTVFIQPGSSLYGLTMIDCRVFGMAADCVFKDCKFIRCGVGSLSIACDQNNKWIGDMSYQDHGALFENCIFDHSACSGCCSGCFLNCKWTGRVIGMGGVPIMAANGHNFTNERAKRLCMFNCTFDQTDRGPILRNAWGDNSDNLYVGVQCLNINSTTNGDEVLAVESHINRFDRNMFFGFRAFNCRNDFMIFDTPANGNLIANSMFGKGCTVAFTGLQPQENNQVRNCQLSESVKVNNFGTLATNTIIVENTVK